jgi:uncharacterized protein YdhG (YjbR/CyaY superfamily)/TfoX/Sxy family transcriptional regulator of competence genes
MSSDVGFVEYVCDQIAEAGDVSFRKMFGEYAVYLDGKVVALVCSDRLFVKPTAGGRAFIGDPVEAPAYAGAKPSFLIENGLDDREWISTLIRITADELPAPKPKRSAADSIDAYIAEFPPETRKALEELRAVIRAAAPGATETISYAIPTFDLNGRHLAHFAGYEKHVGFYPTGRGIEHFKDELAAFKGGKGSVRFPLDRPLPTDLVRRIVEWRVQDSARKA